MNFQNPSPIDYNDANQEISTFASTSDGNRLKLPRVLEAHDLLTFSLLAIITLYSINSVQFGGPAAYLYWMIGTITFLLPCVYICQWLLQRFPGEGGPYLWAKRIFGPRWGFISTFCFWLPGVLAITSAVQSCLVLIRYFVPTWLTTSSQQALGIVVIILVALLIACLPLVKLKHLLFVAAAFYVGIFLLLGVAGLWWLLNGHTTPVPLNQPALWIPTNDNQALFGIVYLALFGVSAPLILAGEVRGGKAGARRSGRFLWWSALISIAAYMLGTFGVMTIVPHPYAGQLAGNLLAIGAVFGPNASSIAAIILILCNIAMIAAQILLLSRLLIVLAADRLLPSMLTHINRNGVPVLSIVTQAAAVVVLTIVPYVISPAFAEIKAAQIQTTMQIFMVLQASSGVLWTLFKVELFAFVFWLIAAPHWNQRLRAQRQAPISPAKRRLLLTAASVGTLAALFGNWTTLSSSWLPANVSDGHWAFLVLGSTLAALGMGWAASELPHLYTVLGEQRLLTRREFGLRKRLEAANDEQQILILQQQELLKEVNRLYKVQARAAVTDPVTGYPNHRAIMNHLDSEVARSKREKSSCVVIFVDLDHFKSVNDTWGHRAGDALLLECAARLHETLRPQDFMGRYGGEEFAVILSDCDAARASRSAEQLRKIIADRPYFWAIEGTSTTVPIHLTASIGVSIYALHGTTSEALIRHADQAMYRAKRMGRNRLCIADLDEEDDQAMQTIHMITERRDTPTLRALMVAQQARDVQTYEHARRIAHLGADIAQVMDLTHTEIELVRLCGLLHDIGKLAIPDTLLHKPGPLTPKEWEVMRRHPELGRAMLLDVGGIFATVGHLIVAHHERWDGRGYPAGLAGTDIPLTARILAVADSFDAMISQRPYKLPMTINQARAELQCCSGSQFDPKVVTTFLHMLDSQSTAHEAHTDSIPRLREVPVSLSRSK